VLNKECTLKKKLVVLIIFLYSVSTFAADPGSLRSLADKKNKSIGAAIMPQQLDDPEFVKLLIENCNYITPENNLKWDAVHPRDTVYDFSGGDKIVNFALKNNMKVRGHNLLWHQANPGWIALPNMTVEKWKALVKDHYVNVMTHYKGKIIDWDVVNEPMDDNGQIRKSLWYDFLGEDYVEFALRTAREVDPDAKLYLNDYAIEEMCPKADGFYKLVKDLMAKGVPLDGVGFQFHIDGNFMPDFASVNQNIKRFADLGLDIQITELDVRLKVPPTENGLNKQAKIYAELMRLMLAYKNINAYIMWGMYDKHSWVPNAYSGYGAAMIIDEKGKQKPAYFAIRDALMEDNPTPAYFDKYITKSEGRVFPSFRAVKTANDPVIDGNTNEKEWDKAISYPFLYNQLDPYDLRVPASQKDVYGSWKIMYKGNKLYGVVNRKDDVTITSNGNVWENDCFELFFNVSGKWNQIRSVVGNDWQKDMKVPGKAAWNKDGTVCEFEVQLPTDSLTGLTIGWLMALADADAPNKGRKCQLYPISGSNTAWTGKGFAELTFENEDGVFVDGPNVGSIPPFNAMNISLKNLPKIDGKAKDACWKEAYTYSFGYNHVSATDKSQPDASIISGDWRLIYNGNMIYGLVNRNALKTITTSKDESKNDNVEISFISNGIFQQYRAVVGKDFSTGDKSKKMKAVWSPDGKVLEFMLEIGSEDMSGKQFQWSIGLINNNNAADADPHYALFPFCGYNLSVKVDPNDLGANMAKKGKEFGVLKFQ
jgi:GH35 family endo-1,4-beta-xylanase